MTAFTSQKPASAFSVMSDTGDLEKWAQGEMQLNSLHQGVPMLQSTGSRARWFQ